jgi:PadR family transcriptional regulator, regulatory protein PadR
VLHDGTVHMPRQPIFREFFLGFIKVHILHHACEQKVYGLQLIAELGRHGYSLSPGTLYPLLHSMEKSGYLIRHDELVGGRIRKYYRATAAGRDALAEIRQKIKELVAEVLEGDVDED